MNTFINSAAGQHLLAGLAIIGAVSALAATGTINGTDALGLLAAVGSFLLGGTLAVNAATQGATAGATVPAPAPTPPAAALPAPTVPATLGAVGSTPAPPVAA